jgi:hypothetical protein
MKRLLLLSFTIVLGLTNSFGQSGQVQSDSKYKSQKANKESSIFRKFNHGKFYGTTTGYLQIARGQDTTVLNFQASPTTLELTKDNGPAYDNCTKKYSTKTTNGKTFLTYEVYSLANSITLVFGEEHFYISSIDGACDMWIDGTTFNYHHEGNTEYLTLVVDKPLYLTNIDPALQRKNQGGPPMMRPVKEITVLPGSKVIMTVRK